MTTETGKKVEPPKKAKKSSNAGVKYILGATALAATVTGWAVMSINASADDTQAVTADAIRTVNEVPAQAPQQALVNQPTVQQPPALAQPAPNQLPVVQQPPMSIQQQPRPIARSRSSR